MIFSGACAALIVIVMRMPLCGLMSVIAGVIFGDVTMDTAAKLCVDLTLLVPLRATLCIPRSSSSLAP